MTPFDLAASTPWAIRPDALELILSIARRENLPVETLELQLGRKLESARSVSVRDGVAIVPLAGPIFRYANVFTRISGATSLEIAGVDFKTALDDPNVKAILLAINSPGGQVDGTSEFAQAINAARASKPVWVHADGAMASGAYWLGSAAERVVVSDTTFVGSIGVVSGYIDAREAEAKNGVRRVEIVSSRAPNKRLAIGSDELRTQIQSQVDAIEDVFVAAIAKHRGVDVDKVLSDFGQGDVLPAAKAVSAGMADAIGTFEATLAELVSHSSPASRPRPTLKGPVAMPEQTPAPETVAVSAISLAYIKASHPQIAEALVAEGRTSGIQAGTEAERKRVLAIQAHGAAAPGHEKLVAELVADPSVTADAAAGRILAAVSADRKGQLDALKKDDTGPAPTPAPPPAPPAPKADDKSKPIEERAKAEYEASADIRAEFSAAIGGLDAYVAYRKAEENGQVRDRKRA